VLSDLICGFVDERQPPWGCEKVVRSVITAQACRFVIPMCMFQVLLTPEDWSESPVQGRTRENLEYL
jgi:hypothetical protein